MVQQQEGESLACFGVNGSNNLRELRSNKTKRQVVRMLMMLPRNSRHCRKKSLPFLPLVGPTPSPSP
jgi:hypothetical protein